MDWFRRLSIFQRNIITDVRRGRNSLKTEEKTVLVACALSRRFTYNPIMYFN